MALSSGCTSHFRGRTLRVWAHQGQEAEHRSLLGIASAFNRTFASRGLRAELSFFPDFQYTEKLSIAAAAGDMPAVFELDGPLVARFVGAKLLARLDGAFSRDELADFLPTIIAQGTVGGSLYALGAFESGALLYFDRAMLEQAGVTPPDGSRGWDWPSFLDACARLAEQGMRPVALHMNESADEWFTYAFAPIIWSGGGALIDASGTSVRGVLASAQNVRSLRAWQLLFQRGYALPDPIDPDPFGNARTAMDWNGHWMLRSHLTAKGERLGVMPLPRAGDTAAAPCGSWCWGISSAASEAKLGALEWLRWVTSTSSGVVPMVRANGGIPGRRSAFAAFPEYRRPPYSVLRVQLEQTARPRPRSRFYGTLTSRFAAALRDIAHGANVEARLLKAENEVTRVIERRKRDNP